MAPAKTASSFCEASSSFCSKSLYCTGGSSEPPAALLLRQAVFFRATTCITARRTHTIAPWKRAMSPIASNVLPSSIANCSRDCCCVFVQAEYCNDGSQRVGQRNLDGRAWIRELPKTPSGSSRRAMALLIVALAGWERSQAFHTARTPPVACRAPSAAPCRALASKSCFGVFLREHVRHD